MRQDDWNQAAFGSFNGQLDPLNILPRFTHATHNPSDSISSYYKAYTRVNDMAYAWCREKLLRDTGDASVLDNYVARFGMPSFHRLPYLFGKGFTSGLLPHLGADRNGIYFYRGRILAAEGFSGNAHRVSGRNIDGTSDPMEVSKLFWMRCLSHTAALYVMDRQRHVGKSRSTNLSNVVVPAKPVTIRDIMPRTKTMRAAPMIVELYAAFPELHDAVFHPVQAINMLQLAVKGHWPTVVHKAHYRGFLKSSRRKDGLFDRESAYSGDYDAKLTLKETLFAFRDSLRNGVPLEINGKVYRNPSLHAPKNPGRQPIRHNPDVFMGEITHELNHGPNAVMTLDDME